MKKHYDYIITGAGLAGLSLLMRMMQHPFFDSASILVVDATDKNVNDRTWCFWEEKPDIFESIVCKKWEQVSFVSSTFRSVIDLSPYTYKMIRGIDLYSEVLTLAARKNNIEFCKDRVLSIVSTPTGAAVLLATATISANKVFNSILFEPVDLLAKKAGTYFLWQHFKGYEIHTDQPVFNDAVATLMDFTVDQANGTTFMYVMPTSPTTALVEYTLFTENLLPQLSYDEAIKSYISQTFGAVNYTIEHQEFGKIPMTNYTFNEGNNQVIHMGVAGGQVKGSSGYAFHFIQEKTQNIIDCLVLGKEMAKAPSFKQKKFLLYDAVLLRVLQDKKLDGVTIFSSIFSKNPAKRVFRFLNNSTSLLEDLQIMASVPTKIFLPAALLTILGVKRTLRP